MIQENNDSSFSLAINVIARATSLSEKEVLKRINSWKNGDAENKSTKLLNKKDVASWLKISLPTVDRYIRNGRLQKVELSTHAVRITEESVKEILNSNDLDTTVIHGNYTGSLQQDTLF